MSGKQLDRSAKTSIKKPLILDVILGKKEIYTRGRCVSAGGPNIRGKQVMHKL